MALLWQRRRSVSANLTEGAHIKSPRGQYAAQGGPHSDGPTSRANPALQALRRLKQS